MIEDVGNSGGHPVEKGIELDSIEERGVETDSGRLEERGVETDSSLLNERGVEADSRLDERAAETDISPCNGNGVETDSGRLVETQNAQYRFWSTAKHQLFLYFLQ